MEIIIHSMLSRTVALGSLGHFQIHAQNNLLMYCIRILPPKQMFQS